MSPSDPQYEELMNKQKLIVDRILAEYEKHQEKTGDRLADKQQSENEEEPDAADNKT